MHDSSTPQLLGSLPPKQPYRINNCKFQNSMISFLSELHNTKAYTDVVLHAEGKLLYAHKVVLAAGSSYFNNLFKSLTTTTETTPQNLVVALPNIKYKDLEMVVKFIYLGYLDIVNSELEGFVELAKQLGVVGMSDDDDEETKEPEGQEETVEDTKDEEDHEETLEEQDHEYQNDFDPPGSPPDLPPPLPNEFLQVNYNDENECLDYDNMEDDEDEGRGASSSSVMYAVGSVEGDKPWKCDKCGKSYNSNKSLWRHKKFTCDEKIEFRCTVCGKSFSRSDNLRRHVVVAHS